MLKNYTIYYVDNDPEDLAVFGKACRNLGYDTVLFDAPEKMLYSLEQRLPSVLFVDLTLPQSSGYEITRELRLHKKFRSVPIVAYSDTSAKANIDRVMALGADLFIRKPMTYGEIQAAVLDAMATLNIEKHC